MTPMAPDFDALNPLRADAVRVEGMTRGGKPCVLLDNTGDRLPLAELKDILQGLIEQEAFGFKVLSPSGGATLDLDRRECAHIQIGDRLYRLLIYRLEARIELF